MTTLSSSADLQGNGFAQQKQQKVLPDTIFSYVSAAMIHRNPAIVAFGSAVLCVLCATCASVQTAPQVLLQGRFGGDVNEQNGLGSPPLIFSWPASSIYATFESTSINATLTALPPTVASSQYTRFAFYVDQQEIAVETTDPNNTSINWGMSGLTAGVHNLTITKLSEASYGQATLESLTVGTNGT